MQSEFYGTFTEDQVKAKACNDYAEACREDFRTAAWEKRQAIERNRKLLRQRAREQYKGR